MQKAKRPRAEFWGIYYLLGSQVGKETSAIHTERARERQRQRQRQRHRVVTLGKELRENEDL